MRRLIFPLLVALASLAFVPAALAATTITVSSFSDTDFNGAAGCSGSGASISCPSLRDAISYANGHFGSGGATIQLKAGTYTVTNGTFGQLVLEVPDAITGAGDTGSGATIIQDSLPGTAVLTLDAHAGTTGVSALELTGGLYGLSVQPAGSNTTFKLDQVNVTDNTNTGASATSPGEGGSEPLSGGIYFAGTSGSVMNVSNSIVQHNIVTGGSGESFSSGPCEGFDGGDGGAAYGGGFYLAGPGTVTISGTTVTGNQAIGGNGAGSTEGCPGAVGGDAVGGGIYMAPNPDAVSVQIEQSTISGNIAQSGHDGVGDGGPVTGSPTADGGALFVVNGSSSATLGNVTLFDNSVQGSSVSHEFGGNLDASDTAVALADSVIADAGPSGVHNCFFGGVTVAADKGYNLEDDNTKTCAFTKATDKVGGAQLATALGNNGGPTETLLPQPGSPVIGNGGACFDLTTSTPGTPLSTDQRGEPRGSICDIGAVQVQRTANTAAPSLSGTPAVGNTLTCNRGGWAGDGLAYSYAWLRGGSPISGASADTYVLQGADAGTSIACQVSASGIERSASAISAADNVGRPSGSTVTLSQVGQLHAKWRESGKGSKHKPPVGTAFKFTLSGPANVTLAFEQTVKGRRSHGKCVAAKRKNHRQPACKLLVARGTLVANEGSGAHSLAFAGKPSHGGRLKPGKYEVVIQASGAGGKPSRAFTLKFTIVK